MQARRHGPISQAKRHGTSKWRLHLGLRRALLRQVGAWVFSLPDQMAYVLAIRVPLLRPSGMVHQTSNHTDWVSPLWGRALGSDPEALH